MWWQKWLFHGGTQKLYSSCYTQILSLLWLIYHISPWYSSSHNALSNISKPVSSLLLLEVVCKDIQTFYYFPYHLVDYALHISTMSIQVTFLVFSRSETCLYDKWFHVSFTYFLINITIGWFIVLYCILNIPQIFQ